MTGKTDQSRRPEAGRHIFGLDLLRVYAAALVALLHLSFEYRPLAFIPPVGWVGVQVFFVISGFVIAGSLTGSSPRRFVRSRLLRLYPTAWGCTIVGASATLIFGGSHAVIGDLATLDARSFVDSLALFGGRFLSSAYWTLQVELAFYAFCLLYFVSSSRRDVAALAKVLIVWAAPYLILLAFCRLGAFEAPWLDFGNGFRNASLLRHGPLFALGILLWRFCPGSDDRRIGAGWFAAALGLSCVEIACRSIELAPRTLTAIAPLAMAALAVCAWATACGFLVVSVLWNARYPAHAGLRAVTRTLGLMTYPFYLIHQSVGGSVMGALVGRGSPDAVALGAGLLASLVLSWGILALWDPLIRAGMRRLGARIAVAVEGDAHGAAREPTPGRRPQGGRGPSPYRP